MPPPAPGPITPGAEPVVGLTIGGGAVTLTTARIVIDRLTQTMDGVDVLEFHEFGSGPVPGQTLHDEVEFTLDGTLRFHGEIAQCRTEFGENGYVHAYVCLGYEYIANRIPITNPATGDGTYLFNLPSTDPDYLASYSGLTLEAILTAVIEDHYTELDAIGVGPFTVGGEVTGNFATALTALDFTPSGAITVSGERLWQTLQGLLDQFAPQYRLHINPDGSMQLYDTTNLDPVTLSSPDDWVEPPALSRDVSECATAVLIRGGPKADAAKLSTADGTLTEDWTGGEEAAWTWADFTAPQDGRSVGAVTAATSTTVTVDPTDNARTWSSNAWGPADRRGWVVLYDGALAGVERWCARAVASNTALVAAGTSVLTLEVALDSTGWTTYDLVGLAQGRTHVWRRYTPTDAAIQLQLLKRFPQAMPFRFEDGVQMTTSPMGEIHWTASSLDYAQATPIEVDPGTGTIWWSRPTPAANNSLDTLITGGGSVAPPDDVVAWVPLRKGRLEARYPASGHAGTAYDDANLEHELVIDLPAWNDPGAQTAFEAYAEQLHAAVKDVVIEGQVVVHGLGANLALGLCLNLAAKEGSATVTTGLEAADLPVRSITIVWPQSGADVIQTLYEVSNRRRPLSGDRLFSTMAHWEPQWNLGGGPTEPTALGGPAALPLPPAAAALSGLGQAALGRFGGQVQGALSAAAPRYPGAHYPTPALPPTPRYPGM